MSQVLYEASPSMVRMNPFGTVVVLLLLIAGVGIALPPVAESLAPVVPLPLVDGAALSMAGMALAVLCLLVLLVWYVKTKVDRLTVKEGEVIWSHGLLNKQYTEINMSSIRTVRVSQTILQRIMGAGDIRVFTSGDLPEVVIRGLPNPNGIRDYVKGDAGAA
jgi:uncharacterized membrane protein YdbT with pleckstrin-like domain